MKNVSPALCFIVCKLLGISLLFAFWLRSSDIAGFFLILTLIGMSLLRQRMPKLKPTIIVDIFVCVLIHSYWEYSAYALALPLFQAMFLGFYPALIALFYLIPAFSSSLAVVLFFTAISGFFLGLWEIERKSKFKLRDQSAERYYDLENLQNGLTTALSQVEAMTSVAERARISRDIHDNAGHEIVAAYISLQTARALLADANPEGLELYDAALNRLDLGANKIREAVHNMSTAVTLGVEHLKSICIRFPINVEFEAFGDTTKVPVHVWVMLEACLNECLTNVARHANATKTSVNLDVTPHIIRFCIENDGVSKKSEIMGRGLSNLRHRAASIGGNLSVYSDDVYRVICVIPIDQRGFRNETSYR
ncbi:MAG: histidine kinase [Defluviitaleaceae bacterium]|nr:histidine kinase [Defluviitaleaceae bacterium]